MSASRAFYAAAAAFMALVAIGNLYEHSEMGFVCSAIATGIDIFLACWE